MHTHNFEVLFINLQKDAEKRVKIKEFLKPLNVTVTRIEAIDGNTINNPLDYIDINFKDPIKGRNQTLGELGCALSHIKAWEKCIELDKPVLILEDDVTSDYPPSGIINALREADTLLEDHGLVYLGRQQMTSEFNSEEKWVEPNYSWLAHAYMITPKTAEALLDPYYKTHIIPVDEWIPYLIGNGCNTYVDVAFSPFVKSGTISAMAYHDPELLVQNRTLSNATETMDEILVHDKDIGKIKSAIITVATDEGNYGFNLLCQSVYQFGHQFFHNLGQDVEWEGGDVSVTPGAGQKVNLVRNFINNSDISDDDVILFLDGYDTYMYNNLSTIIGKWLDNFDENKALFSAETTCWPDSSISDKFPVTDTGYNFLNSGSFIGKVGVLKQIMPDDIINNDDDDQAYYQSIFLSTDLIELDSSCQLFQSLAGSMGDIMYEGDGGFIFNNATGTIPCILHGNGGKNEKRVYYDLIKTTQDDRNPGNFRRWTGPLQ